MQPIERYGVVALVFLVVTVVAVLLWDSADAQAAEPKLATAAVSTRGLPSSGTDASLVAAPRARPLRRDALEAQGESPNVLAAPAGLERGSLASDSDDPARSLARSELDERVGSRDEVRQVPRRREPVVTERAPSAPAARRTTPPESTSTALGDRVHVVAAGDTLTYISLERLGTSKRWKEIVECNPGLDPARLRVGARLRLPAGTTAAATSEPAARAAKPPATVPRSTAATGDVYVVRAGDSLWKIAQRELGDRDRWREIRDANADIDANRLSVGQRLSLPAGAKRTPASSDATVAQVTPRSSGRKVR